MFFLYKRISDAYLRGESIDYPFMFYMFLHTASVITELYMLNAVCFNAMQQVNHQCKSFLYQYPIKYVFHFPSYECVNVCSLSGVRM